MLHAVTGREHTTLSTAAGTIAGQWDGFAGPVTLGLALRCDIGEPIYAQMGVKAHDKQKARSGGGCQPHDDCRRLVASAQESYSRARLGSPTIPDPISVYDNWSTYDELSDNVPLTQA